MATVKIILRTSKKNAAGEAPLCIRIIEGRQTRFISLKFRVRPEMWDSINSKVTKKHPNYLRLNHFIAQKYAEAQGASLKIAQENKPTTPEKIKEQIVGKTPESFFKYADRYLTELEASPRVSTFRKIKAIVGKVKQFQGARDLLFQNITVTWLKEYEIYLMKDLKNKLNTVNSNFRSIRAIINLAINEELIPEKNPFSRYKLTTEKVKKDYLTENELMLLEQASLIENSTKELHRDMFVFSVYAAGLRISDVLMLKWKNFDGERIVAQTKKTSSTVSVKLPTKARDILKNYHTEFVGPEDFIFPVLLQEEDYSDPSRLHNSISSGTAHANKDLKAIAKMAGIDKKVSFHTARHTFATLALKRKVPIQDVSRLLGHSSITQTMVYAKIVNEDLDEAMGVFEEPLQLYLKKSA